MGSKRLVDQNIWNAILSNLSWDDRTDAALRTWGVDEFFEGLAGLFPYEENGPLLLHDNSAFTAEERQSLETLVALLNEAWDSSGSLSGDEFLETEWATRVRRAMAEAESVMRERGGYFSTVREEQEPSLRHPTACPHTIYVPLLDEGTDVWRPADAEYLGGGRYRVLGPMPEHELWAFPPGALASCEWKILADGKGGMIAMKAGD